MDFRIPLGHLYSTGVPFHMTDEAQAAESGMMDMLLNRDQVIADKQAGQIGSLIADVKMGEILPDLQQRAMERITKFTNDTKGLYASQNNRTRLSQENLNKAMLMKQQLMADLSAMQQITKDYYTESKNIPDYVKNGYLNQTEVDLSDKEFRNAVRTPGTNFMDMPLYSVLMAKKVAPKAAKEDALKIRNKFEDEIVSQMSGVSFAQPTAAEVSDFMKTRYPENSPFWGDYRRSLEMGGVIDQADDYKTALMKAATSLRPSIKPRNVPASTVFNLNNGGGSQKAQKEPTVIPENADNIGRYWDLSTLTQKPKFTGVHINKENKEVPIKNADIIAVRIDNGQAKMIIQGKVDGVANGDVYTFEKPVSRTVMADLEKKGIMLDGYTMDYTDAGSYNATKGVYGKPVQPAGKKSNKETEAQKLGL